VTRESTDFAEFAAFDEAHTSRCSSKALAGAANWYRTGSIKK
jgi:hypothetical protein